MVYNEYTALPPVAVHLSAPRVPWEYPPRIIGGISRVVCHLAHELGAAGHKVTVLTMTDENVQSVEAEGPVTVRRVPAWLVRPVTFLDGVSQMNMEMVAEGVRTGSIRTNSTLCRKTWN